MTNTNTNLKTVFSNDLCSITLRKDNTFYGADKTDFYNEPRMYTENTRSFKKGLALLEKNFSDSTTMYQVARMLDEVGLKAHTYCAVN